MRRRRRLRPDEADLWAKVIETATPLRPTIAAAAPPDPPRPPVPAVPQTVQPPLILPQPRPAPGGGVSVDLKPSVSDRLAQARVDMDRKKFGRLKRGKLVPEARLDLHGLTQAEAHSELTAFVLMSHQIGRRLVLVITGKGRGEGRAGILRQQVPHWLSLPPLRQAVLQLAEAHQSHGGNGAISVYLRRRRED
jgi:DNA-nicking Smr family endonuclease